jgi:hypothetical protein
MRILGSIQNRSKIAKNVCKERRYIQRPHWSTGLWIRTPFTDDEGFQSQIILFNGPLKSDVGTQTSR